MEDGRGGVVPLRGGARLEIRFRHPAHDDAGNVTYQPADRNEALVRSVPQLAATGLHVHRAVADRGGSSSARRHDYSQPARRAARPIICWATGADGG